MVKTYDFSVWLFEETGPILVQKERDTDGDPVPLRVLITFSLGKVSMDMAIPFKDDYDADITAETLRDKWFEELSEDKVKGYIISCFPKIFKG